jgi:hypothetical protein
MTDKPATPASNMELDDAQREALIDQMNKPFIDIINKFKFTEPTELIDESETSSLISKIIDANDICVQLKFNFKFELEQIYNEKTVVLCVRVLNQVRNLITLWRSDYFNDKLWQLNDAYQAHVDKVGG